jgi:phage/plasmid primase-like uncharacterized protein
MTIDRELIERADSVDLVALAQKYGCKLVKRGKDWNGPCPQCGGDDRFVITPKKGVFYCRGCNASGDAIALLQFITGCNFHDAIERLTGAPLPQRQEPVKPKPKPNPDFERQISAELFQWWHEAKPIGGTPAEAYLVKTRHIDVEQIPDVNDVLRFHPRCIFGHRRFRSCLLALIRDIVTDEPIGFVRTSIDAQGRKAPVTDDGKPVARKILGAKAGGAIKLWSDAAVTTGLVIGEGLESVASAATRINYKNTLLQPAWALIDASNLATFPVLAGIEHLTILVDNDASSTGQKAADECTRTWTGAGCDVEQLIPDIVDTDFNNLARVIGGV